MSFYKLLSGDRKTFVDKAFTEMNSNILVNTSDRENQKNHFLQLVEENKELSEIEKQYCRERKNYFFELKNARCKLGKPIECNTEKCISLHLQSLFNTWTSGNEIIDNFIHQSQILSSLPNHILE